jgi:hypothetical protein
MIFVSSQAGLTVASAGSHPDETGGCLISGCLFVGWSDNKGTHEADQPPMNTVKRATSPRGPSLPVRGFQFYDGPQTLDNCTFREFEPDSYAKHSAIANFYRESLLGEISAHIFPLRPLPTFLSVSSFLLSLLHTRTTNASENMWQMATTNEVLGCRFDAKSQRYWSNVVLTSPALRLDGDTNFALADRLGSVTGYAGAYVLPRFPYFSGPNCRERADWNAVVCPHKMANVWIENLDTPSSRYNLKDNLKAGLLPVRDQHKGQWKEVEQTLFGIGERNSKGDKYRYQLIASTDASYTLNFPHVTPAALRIQLNNADRGDALRYGICVPPGVSDIKVLRGLFKTKTQPGSKATATPLPSAPSLDSPAFQTGDAYFYDAAHNLLFVRLVQRYDRQDKFNYCPEEGCEQLWIDIKQPSGASVGHCAQFAYPFYRDTDGPFYAKTLQPAAAGGRDGTLLEAQPLRPRRLESRIARSSEARMLRLLAATSCGDGVCNNGETCVSCPVDCGGCQVLPCFVCVCVCVCVCMCVCDLRTNCEFMLFCIL